MFGSVLLFFSCFSNKLYSDTKRIFGPIKVPNGASSNATEDIITNCKYLCTSMEKDIPYIFTCDNSGKSIYAGFTYEKSENPAYARFIIFHIGNTNIISVCCFDHKWNISEK